MSAAEYKLLFDGVAATREELDRFESIIVEREADRPSQARLELGVCLDDQGNWAGDDEPFMEVLRRVRVEVKVDEGSFEALIDGPIVGFDSARSAAPGQSTVSVVVHDDSALMHRAAAAESYAPGLKDSDIATLIFGEYDEIAAPPTVEETPDAPDPLPPELRRRGTHMQLLRFLARRNDLVCAVVPGATPGASIGVFHSTPVFEEEPPELILLGRNRNIETFDVQLNAEQQSNVVASTLSFSDKRVVTRRSQVRNLQLIGEAAPLDSDDKVGEQVLRPGAGEGVDLQHRVDREARRTSRVFEATGAVRQACYAGVLKPFHPVKVRLGTTKTSGTYVIQRVTHRLSRSDYRQDFTLVADSLSQTTSGPDLVPAGLF